MQRLLCRPPKRKGVPRPHHPTSGQPPQKAQASLLLATVSSFLGEGSRNGEGGGWCHRHKYISVVERKGKSSVSLQELLSFEWHPGPFKEAENFSGVSPSDWTFSGVSWLRSSRLLTDSVKELLGSSFNGEAFGVLHLTFENSATSFLTGVFLSALPNGDFLQEEQEQVYSSSKCRSLYRSYHA